MQMTTQRARLGALGPDGTRVLRPVPATECDKCGKDTLIIGADEDYICKECRYAYHEEYNAFVAERTIPTIALGMFFYFCVTASS